MWSERSFFIFNYHLDCRFYFCYYILSMSKCWIIYTYCQFLYDLQEQIWNRWLGVCVESWGYHNNKANWCISTSLAICSHTQHLEFYAQAGFGRVWDNRDGCDWYLWEVYKDLHLGCGKWFWKLLIHTP